VTRNVLQSLTQAVYLATSGASAALGRAALLLDGLPVGGWAETRQATLELTNYLPHRRDRSYTVGHFVSACYEDHDTYRRRSPAAALEAAARLETGAGLEQTALDLMHASTTAEGRTVHGVYSDALARELEHWADGCTESALDEPTGQVLEYWGKGWRVQLVHWAPPSPTADPVVCAACGVECRGKPGGGTGYGETDDGRKLCYPCCGAREIARLTRREPTTVYLGSTADTVTDWPGTVLGRVVEHHRIRSRSVDPVYAVRVIDVHGGRWFGRGSAGMALLLRPAKS
jgi:hypothetical protein